MIASLSRMALPGGLFLLTLLSGVWLTLSGRPLNTLLLTAHKLAALAAIVLTGIAVYRLLQSPGQRALIETGMVILAGLLFLALIASGGLLSLDKPAPRFVLTIHQVAPLLGLAAAAAAVYLLSSSHS